jgi:hypothetical protein
MSGGTFDYDQYKISYIADQIEHEIEKSGRKKTAEELKEQEYRSQYWDQTYPEDLYHYEYPPEVIEKFKEGVKALRIAQIYAQRIDWLLSGDDGEESFLRRLKEELNEI